LTNGNQPSVRTKRWEPGEKEGGDPRGHEDARLGQAGANDGTFHTIDFVLLSPKELRSFEQPSQIALLKEKFDRTKRRIMNLTEERVYHLTGAIGRNFISDWDDEHHQDFQSILIFNRYSLSVPD
jgi:hypothetical protein